MLNCTEAYFNPELLVASSSKGLSWSPVSYKFVGESWGGVVDLGKKLRFNLNKDGSSWVDAFYLPNDLLPSGEELAEIWELHPEKRGKGKIMGKVIEFPRWQQSYNQAYTFTGMNHEALPVPKEIERYLDFANESEYSSMYGKNWKFTQILLNWYGNGSDYIGPHADSEGQLKKNSKGETLVYSVTFQRGKESRTFRLKPKTGGKDRLDIRLDHGLVLVMGGRCQSTHKHQVPKVNSKPERFGKRINLTFRIFK